MKKIKALLLKMISSSFFSLFLLVTTLSYAEPPVACEEYLQPYLGKAVFEGLAHRIETQVQREGLDIPEAMRREFARPILDTGRDLLLKRVEEIYSQWRTLHGNALKTYYEIASLENFLRTHRRQNASEEQMKEREKAYFPVYLGYELNPENHLPQLEFIQENKVIAQEVMADVAEQAQKNKTSGNIGIQDLVNRVSAKLLDRAKSSDQNRLRVLANQWTEKQEHFIAETELKTSPFWNVHWESGKLELMSIVEGLESRFPYSQDLNELGRKMPGFQQFDPRTVELLDKTLKSGDEISFEALASVFEEFKSITDAKKKKNIVDRVNASRSKLHQYLSLKYEEKKQNLFLKPWNLDEASKVQKNEGAEEMYEMSFPKLKARVVYKRHLATVELLPDKTTKVQNGPILGLLHGEGTLRSIAASFKYLIAGLVSKKWNPRAVSLPNAGIIGPTVDSLQEIMAYLHQVFSEHSRLTQRSHEEWKKLPLVELGRSMGAVKLFTYDLLYPDNPVDIKILMSHSIPTYFREASEAIYDQARRGVRNGIFKSSMQNADRFSSELLALLKMLEEKDPKRFLFKKRADGMVVLFGDDQWWLQGNNDEDGRVVNGQNMVMEDLYEFRDRYAPAAHIIEFEDRQKHLPLEEVPADKREGMHHLLSEDPVLSDQKFKVMGYLEAIKDYYVDEGQAQIPAQAVEYRKWFCNLEAKRYGQTETFLDLYVKEAGLTDKDFQNANRDSKVTSERRAAAILEIRAKMKSEKERKAHLLKNYQNSF